jgi:hypothetical protein
MNFVAERLQISGFRVGCQHREDLKMLLKDWPPELPVGEDCHALTGKVQ